MKPLYRSLLKYICSKIVRQGYDHDTVEYYKIMYEASKTYYTEDNKPTLDSFLQECFNKSKED